jgi:hypothetical protein
VAELTPPQKLRAIADEMEAAHAAGIRDGLAFVAWRRRLQRIVNGMDAAIAAKKAVQR